MTEINVNRLVSQIYRTNVYTPIIEAIVNSIDSIVETKRTDGQVTVTLLRSSVLPLDPTGNEKPSIIGLRITDNGIGFNDDNFHAFDRIYTERKVKQGGKGFGRLVYLKYFKNVSVQSTYLKDGEYMHRTFNFVKKDQLTENIKISKSTDTDSSSTLILESLEESRFNKLDKRIETISRKLLENLLDYFALDGFTCPKITIQEEDGDKKITLNDFFGKDNGIIEVGRDSFDLTTQKVVLEREKFNVKIFKINYGESRSSINLLANGRSVTETALYLYVPEFKEDFTETITNEKGDKIDKTYTIKAYVQGPYLDKNVLLERDGFMFQDHKSLMYSFSQPEIEKEAAMIAQKIVSDEVLPRQKKKESMINDYVNKIAPWHKPFVGDLDLASVPYNFNEEEIEGELQKVKYKVESKVKKEIKVLMASDKTDISNDIKILISKVTDAAKSDLAHYVSTRKAVLNMLNKMLLRLDDGSAKYEEDIHNIIFPMGKDSTKIDYEGHNLWILDERLVFSSYVASDRKITKKQGSGEPDLIIFNNRVAYRQGENEAGNPLTIFEFKRPKRETYSNSDDPILQVIDYLKEIRKGKYETPKGAEVIRINEYTPVYGYIICDITEKIKEFAERYDFTPSADNEGYFGYQKTYKIYFEIISYKKLLKDANLRNKIFFRKLGILS